jgi:hypothetical protein
MKKLFKLTLTVCLGLLVQFANAQDNKPQQVKRPSGPTEEKRLQRDHFRRDLGLDSAKAEQVLKIQTEYKTGMRALEADTSIGDAGKQAKKLLLVGEKNRKLKLLLSPSQQQKLIPTSELGTTPQQPYKQ